MLRVEHVTCGYGEKAVIQDVSFQLEEGERIGIIGPNGCGKTTLLRAICGLLPSQGEIYIEDKNLREMKRKDISKKVAFMPQMSNVLFSYTVYETVMLGRYAHGKHQIFQNEQKEDREWVLACLEKTGILSIKDKLITELSGGQLQRVYLARVFAQNPNIILLDEPTNHLDLKYQIELVEELKSWSREKRHAVIGVFHDINLALSFANRILLLEDGKIVELQRSEDFDLEKISRVYGMDVKKYMLHSLKRWDI